MDINQIKSFLTKVNEKRNNFALVAAVISLIAMFMPYAKASFWGFSQSINYMSTDNGKIFLVLLIVASVLYFLQRDGMACVASILMLLVSLYDFIDTNSLISDTYGIATQSIGSYLVILGAGLMVAAPFIGAKVEQFVSSKMNTNN